MHKKIITLNKPLYLGFCTLESSKLKIFQLHYAVIQKVYPNCSILKTDTASLLYQIHTDDLYKDLLEIIKTKFFN